MPERTNLMKYVISDLHFNHANVIAMDHRPFSDVNEMNATLIENWNKVVLPKDEVYILGDLSFGSAEEVTSIIKQLKGRKYLIRGNHDYFLNDETFDTTQFEWIKDLSHFKENHIQYQLCHYPILEYNGYFSDHCFLYGHVHNNRQKYFQRLMSPNAVNVGASMIGYKPISVAEIEKIITAQWQAKLESVYKLKNQLIPDTNEMSLDEIDFSQYDKSVSQDTIVNIVTNILENVEDDELLETALDTVPAPQLQKARLNAMLS